MNPEAGCYDINECVRSSVCNSQQFCVNNEGSYTCLDCDRSCEGCTGDGPDMCQKCADNYQMKDGKCSGWYYSLKFQVRNSLTHTLNDAISVRGQNLTNMPRSCLKSLVLLEYKELRTKCFK